MRKLLILVFILTITNLGLSQSIKELKSKKDSLNLLLKDIDKKIKRLERHKRRLKSKVSDYNKKIKQLELAQKTSGGFLVEVEPLGKYGRFYDSKNRETNKVIDKIPEGDSVLVYTDYKYPFFKAKYEDTYGYISQASLKKNEIINNIIEKGYYERHPKLAPLEEKYGRQKAKLFLRYEKKFGKEEAKKKIDKFIRLEKQYGTRKAHKIMNGKYWIGMTKKMAKESLGRPTDINRSKGPWGTKEQWVYQYQEIYLYFENGVLTSFQD